MIIPQNGFDFYRTDDIKKPMYKNAMAIENSGSKQAGSHLRESRNVSGVDRKGKSIQRKCSCRKRLDSDEDNFMNGIIRK